MNNDHPCSLQGTTPSASDSRDDVRSQELQKLKEELVSEGRKKESRITRWIFLESNKKEFLNKGPGNTALNSERQAFGLLYCEFENPGSCGSDKVMAFLPSH
ncbi:hypothetical protein Ancab_025969 [Ancistrocladus abbreviatus]